MLIQKNLEWDSVKSCFVCSLQSHVSKSSQEKVNNFVYANLSHYFQILGFTLFSRNASLNIMMHRNWCETFFPLKNGFGLDRCSPCWMWNLVFTSAEIFCTGIRNFRKSCFLKSKMMKLWTGKLIFMSKCFCYPLG